MSNVLQNYTNNSGKYELPLCVLESRTVAKWQNSGKLELPLLTRYNSKGYKNTGKTVATRSQTAENSGNILPPLKGGSCHYCSCGIIKKVKGS